MIGTKLSDRYELLRELGRGGMGVVYLSYDPLLEREVAIKLIPPSHLTQESEERFRREARVIAKMDHPAVVVVYDVGQHEGALYFVMPYIKGTNLRKLLDSRSLRLGDVISIGIQIAEALDYSHASGVVHRDIKPENILITQEEGHRESLRVRVTDFGLAVASTENRLTRSGAMVGTIGYFSPEQISGGEITGSSDLYSLGTVLYECLVGEIPFEGEIQNVLYRIVHDSPVLPRTLGKVMEEDLERVVMECLEKDPANRPARGRDIADALMQIRSRVPEDEQSRLLLSASEPIEYRKPASAFIGREKEFSELQRRLQSAAAGECQFILIGGDAGIGKSRLMEELEKLARVRRFRVLHGRFVEEDQSFPYHGFCELIQEAFGSRAGRSSLIREDFSDLIPDLVRLFPILSEVGEIRSSTSSFTSSDSAPSDLSPGRMEDRVEVFELLARTFSRIGNSGPLLILLEDLHAEEASLEAMQYIVRRLGTTTAMIVGAYRTTEVDRGHALTQMIRGFKGDRHFFSLTLGPFPPEEHREFLQSVLLSVSLDDRLVETIFEATEGNPYFARELVQSLRDSGAIVQDPNGFWSLAAGAGIRRESLPATIQKTVEGRIERLPDEHREILSIASVLGRSFEYKDLEVLAEDVSDLEEAVDSLVESGFLQEERESRSDRLSFSSGVIRDVLYSQISRRKRRTMHRNYAEHLEKRYSGRLERIYPQLVHHYIEGDVREKIIRYGLLMADRAVQTFSAEEAVRALKAVVDCMEDEPVDADVEVEARLLLSSAFRMQGQIPNSLKELQRTLEILKEKKMTERLPSVFALAAETAWEGRRSEETRRYVEKGLSLNPGPEVRNRLLSLGATVAGLGGDHEKAKEYLQKLEEMKPRLKEAEESLPTGGTLVVALSPEMEARFPAIANMDEEGEVLANVFETLARTDAQGNIIPWLCEQWEPMEQGQSFLFSLRPEIILQDDRPLTTMEIRNSIEHALRLSSRNMPQAFVILRGVSEFLSGASKELSGIQILSDLDFMLSLQEPLPIYPSLLTDIRTAIAVPSPDDVEVPVGTGAFAIRSWRRDHCLLTRNDRYWRESRPFLEQLEFRASLSTEQLASGLRSGEFDMVRDLAPEDLEEVLRVRHLRAGLMEAPRKNIYFVLFRSSSPFCEIPQVRRVLSESVQTHSLVRSTLGRFGQPAEGFIPPGILGYDPSRRHYTMSIEEAAELLKSCGKDLPLSLKAAVHPVFQDRYHSVLKALFRIWNEIGVEVEIVTPSMTSYLGSRGENETNDLLIGRYTADYDDPDNFIYGLFHSRVGHFRYYYSSTELDRLMEEARLESHPESRRKLYRKLEGLLLESGFVLPLFHDIDCRVIQPDIRNASLRSSPPYVNYSEVSKSRSEASAPSQRERGGILYVPIAGEIQNLDPSMVFLVVQTEVIPTIFETLTRESEGARVVPWLASSYQAEDGGRRYRFQLRENLRFHDGRRLTARDVRYSFERLLKNQKSVSRWPLSSILGAEKLMDGDARELAGFTILSALEFTMDLERPVPFFPALLAFPSAAIVPEGSEVMSGNWREGCVGTGPFRISRFEPGIRLELEANPHYWRAGYPKCDGLVFIFGVDPQEIRTGFQNGRFSLAWDLFPVDVEILRRDSGVSSLYGETPRLSTYFVVLNNLSGPLSDWSLRKRLSQSVDVEGLVRRNLGRLAIPAHGLIPPGLPGFVPEGSGSRTPMVTPGADSRVELTAIVNSVYEGPYSTLAEELLRIFHQKGIVVQNISQTRSEYMRALASATADIVLTRWIADYPDPDTFIHGLLHSEKGILGKMCGSPEIDRLIEQGRAESNPDLRREIYRETEDFISRNVLLIPLFHEQAYCFARPNVEGFQVTFSRTIVPYEKMWVRK